MAGGFSGKMKVVSDTDRTAAGSKLKDELRGALLIAARAQAPEGYMLSDAATQIVFSEIEKEGQDLKKDEALVTLSGKLTGALVLTSNLAQILAEKLAAQRDDIVSLSHSARYTDVLMQLAELREPVDDFFEHVLVMTDDKPRRENRLLLLKDLRALFLHVADIALLQ